MSLQKTIQIEKNDYQTICYECELAGYKKAGWNVVGDVQPEKPEANASKPKTTQTKSKIEDNK